MNDEKPKRRWQNLLHKKCPNCDARLEDAHMFFKCPVIKEDGRNCFFIRKTKAIEFLMDPEHPANICLAPHERDTLNEALKDWEIVV